MFADVIVDINNVEVDKIFEYYFDDCQILIGSRVLVPFGRKELEGIVIGVKEISNYPPEKIKPIIKLLEDTPALTRETLSLMNFVKNTCYVTRASALRLFLPSEMRKGRVKEQFIRYVELVDSVNLDQEVEKLRKTAVRQKDLLFYLQE